MTVTGRSLAMLGLVACAAACGGGGDNGGTGNPPPPVNRAPVAVVSGPTDTAVGASATFDGRGSSDADGDRLSYRWTLFAPSGSNATLGGASADLTTLVPDVAGSYRIQLVVNDGRLDSVPAEHTLTAAAPSPIQATLLTPRGGDLVADSFQVVVTLVSTYEVQGVRATLAGTQTDLAFKQDAWCPRTDDCGPGFVATLSLAAHPPGPFTLTIRATDVRGNSDERSIEIVHDNPPVLTATAPVDQSVALPTIPVDASCQDDLPGCVIELLVNDQLQKTEPSSLSGVFDLTPWTRQRVTMTFRARDSAGQRVIRNVSVFVEDSTRLAVLAEVPGPILDTDGRRLLFVEHLASGDRLAIHDALTGLSETVTMPEGRSVRPTSAFLTPTGAIFVTQAVDGNVLSSRLYLWRNGTFTDLAYPDSSGSLEVAGNYAIWNEGTDLYRIDTTTASQLLVTSDAGNTDNAVTADGTVVFWNRSYQIVRDRLGQQAVLADGAGQWHVYPVADGDQVVYRQQDPCCSNQEYALVLIDGDALIPLTAPRTQQPQRQSDYQVSGGWSAYTDLGNLGQTLAFTRSPAGVVTRHSDLGSSNRLDRLADNGELMVTSGNLRFFSRGAGSIEIGSSNGRSFWANGTWYLALGRVLFSVDTSE